MELPVPDAREEEKEECAEVEGMKKLKKKTRWRHISSQSIHAKRYIRTFHKMLRLTMELTNFLSLNITGRHAIRNFRSLSC